MWNAGVTRRRRHLALNQLVERSRQSGNLTAPWQEVPTIWEHFRDEAEVLRELQSVWRNALAGAVYVAIERGQGDLRQDVVEAFSTVATRYAGIRAILEFHAEHPAIATAMRKEHALLSTFACAQKAAQQAAQDAASDRAA